jgi:hypothetical protein
MAVLLTLGCTHTYQRVEGTGKDLVLERDVNVYVTRPTDYHQGGDYLYKSGEMTAALLRNNLSLHVTEAILAPTTDHFTNSVAQALDLQCRYLFVPVILDWSDYQTRNSGRRDTVRVGITVFELPSTNIVHSSEIRGKSRWFRADDDDVPEDLLITPMRDYVMDLYLIRQPPPPAPDKQMLSAEPGF